MNIDQMIARLQELRKHRGNIDVVLENSSNPEDHYAVRGLRIGHYIGYQLYTPVVFIDHMADLVDDDNRAAANPPEKSMEFMGRLQRAKYIESEYQKMLEVKALRDKTGAGMMDSKNALKLAHGHEDLAQWYLMNKGLAIVQSKTTEEQLAEMVFERETSELPQIAHIKDYKITIGGIELDREGYASAQVDLAQINRDFSAESVTDLEGNTTYFKTESLMSCAGALCASCGMPTMGWRSDDGRVFCRGCMLSE
jgi:hypothetical protein